MIVINRSVIENSKIEFTSRDEYGFADLSGIFDINYLENIEKSIINTIDQIQPEKNIYGSFKKYRLSELRKMPECASTFIDYLNSSEFLFILEQITGIDKLIPDPDLQGGGVHAIEAGGFLKLHTDFNWNKKLGAHRRLNLLIYLNSDWNEDWGGSIELWNSNAEKMIFKLGPKLGKVMLFATTDYSYHGHPDPLTCPPGVWRKSIAIYYYTKERPKNEILFGESALTNYVERPGEFFKNDKIRKFRHKLQISVKKFLHAFISYFNRFL